MERFINILIVDENKTNQKGLKEILSGGGNNVLLANSVEEAITILHQKEIGILLVNSDNSSQKATELLKLKNHQSKNIYKIVMTADSVSGSKMVKGINEGAVDFITIPFNPNLIQAKIEVFKALFYKDQRITELLENIFPATVLEDLNTNSKFNPKRIENGIILFTDFVDFSLKARDIKPLRLLKKLEYYFTKFDEIVERYKLEKIKTIGDAYMVLGGVTENHQEPEVRACLAAIEMRDFMRNEKEIALALNRDYWEVRIGLHMGPLVAGIIGTSKISFDVWGDTVNIAARAEAVSKPGYITITKNIANAVQEYMLLEQRGLVNIHKRGGSIEMFYLIELKLEHSLYGEGKIAGTALRLKCGLSSIDFSNMRKACINLLKSLLPEGILYHDLSHTYNVEKAAVRFAKLEGIDQESILLLQTAVLYHDAGFIIQYKDNEKFAVQIAQKTLPKYGYSNEQIEVIVNIIASTAANNSPKTLLEKIMCDADHDYLGRADYFTVVSKLRAEMENFGEIMNDETWINFQLHYLEKKHLFFTETAKNIRLHGKKARIEELKTQLSTFK